VYNIYHNYFFLFFLRCESRLIAANNQVISNPKITIPAVFTILFKSIIVYIKKNYFIQSP